MNPTLRIKRLTETAIVPRYQSAGAAGLDLHADLDGSGASGDIWSYVDGRVCHIRERWVSVGTGIAVEIPSGYEGQIRGRSGLAFKHDFEFYVGTIDSDYRGEIRVLLRSLALGGRQTPIRHGDRIAQLVIAPVARCCLSVTNELSETARGEGGFGHSGR